MRADIRLPFSGKIDIQVDYARQLYLAMQANGDRPKNMVTFDELEGLHNAETFEGFLKVNRMVTFEEVVR